jgi:hypothetical protein
LVLSIIQKSGYIMADETPIPVLTVEKKQSTHKGYHWVYFSPVDKLLCFIYHKSRGREAPGKFLENFSGYLQTDGYAVYDTFGKRKEITLAGCMAHARRKFKEALDGGDTRAEEALASKEEASMNSTQQYDPRARSEANQQGEPTQSRKVRLTPNSQYTDTKEAFASSSAPTTVFEASEDVPESLLNFLRDVSRYPDSGIAERYKRLGLSVRQGQRQKQALIDQRLIMEEVEVTHTAKRRVVRLTDQGRLILLATDAGREHMKE